MRSKHRRFTTLLGAAAAAWAASSADAAPPSTRPSQQPPNIILILADDLGWRDLGCYGGGFYETPNLDRLAAQGMRFTDAYAACPVCSPTRASILTGKYPARLGLTNWIEREGSRTRYPRPWRGTLIDAPNLRYLPLEETSLAAALEQGGYATWHIGKWHLGGEAYWPEKHGFDVNIGGCDHGHPYAGYFSPYKIPTLPDGPAGEYLTDRLTDEAIRLIEKGGDRPFFLNYWPYAVHTPIQAPAPLVEKYKAKARAMGLDQVQAIEDGQPMPPLEGFSARRMRRRVVQSDPVYAAMVENLDWNIGRLLAAVEQAGQAHNTLVVFTSDNGGLATHGPLPTCNLPLAQGKAWLYEGGIRVPLIVSWPGTVQPATTCDVPVTSTDLYPTLLEAAGLPAAPAQHLDGVSFLPLLQGAATLDRQAIYWHYPHYGTGGSTPASAMRMGDWKLIETFEDGRLELYDLRRDIGETHNLADQQPQRARRMQQMLADWRRQVQAKMPERNPNPPGPATRPAADVRASGRAHRLQ